jgi:hypothetical protein
MTLQVHLASFIEVQELQSSDYDRQIAKAHKALSKNWHLVLVHNTGLCTCSPFYCQRQLPVLRLRSDVALWP